MQFSYKRDGEAIEFGLIYGLIAIIAVVVARFLPLLTVAPACVFRSITGFPCPTCGSTRSLVKLAGGDLPAAFAYNPLFCITVLIAGGIFFYSLFRLMFSLPRISVHASGRERAFIKTALILTVLVNWTYLFLNL